MALITLSHNGACFVEVAEYKTEYTGGVTSVQAHGAFIDAVNCYVT